MPRKLLVFLALALAPLTTSSASAQQPTQAPDHEPEKLDSVNAAVVTARIATKDKRYADAEILMLKVTADKPQIVIPWVELGLAQTLCLVKRSMRLMLCGLSRQVEKRQKKRRACQAQK